MLLNNVEVDILATIELIDAYNKIYPEEFIYKNVIYCVHNNVNGKNYIGQTIEFSNRFSDSYIGHFKDYNKYKNGKLKDSRILYKAWNKYGLESFTVYIIDVGDGSRESLNEKEVYWIKTLHTCTQGPECFGYNLTWGADDMGVKDPESIKKSLATRLEKYGTYLHNCHTHEALEKGNQTKLERYGKTGFINASTPEANEKRRQTNLERYGTKHGPRMSEESLKTMLQKKIDLYGDIMGTCNTPENREKAVRNGRITKAFINIDKYLSLNSDIFDWDEYCNFVIKTVKTLRDAERHIEVIIEYLEYFKSDNRATDQIKTILSKLDTITKDEALEAFHKKEEEWRKGSSIRRQEASKRIDNHKRALINTITKLNRILDSNSTIKNWETFSKYTILTYSKPEKARYFLNKLIDNLADLKKLDKWSPRLEKIFGQLTEKDKLKGRR